MSITEKHLSELRASGISKEVAEAAGIRSVNSTVEFIGFELGAAWVIPFHGPNGEPPVFLVKADSPRKNSEQKIIKYEWRLKTPFRAYIPSSIRGRVINSKDTLIITEGCKKVLSANEAGFLTIGFSGVWGWVKDKNPLPDIDAIPWDRDVYLAFDSDFAENDDVRRALLALGTELSKRGARVRVVDLPQEGSAKVGLDDFIVTYGREALQKLLEKARLINEWGAKKVSKREWPVPGAGMFFGLAGEMVRAIAPNTEADPVGMLGQFHTFFGNILGRKPHIMVGDTRHGMNIFVVTVGESSKSRKGTAKDHIHARFEQIDPIWAEKRIMPALSSSEGLIWAVRDPSNEIDDETGNPNDPGVKDKRLLVIKSEFSAMLKVMRRESNPLSETVREAWDGGILAIPTKNFPARASQSHISIICHVTKADLLRHLTETDAANGFGNRFLWLAVRRSQKISRPKPISAQAMIELSKRLEKAINFAQAVEELTWSEEAGALWDNVYQKGFLDRPGLVGDLTTRGEAQTLRLACLYALENESSVIEIEHLKAALAFWRYAENSAVFIFGENLGDDTANELLKAIRNSLTGMSRTQIHEYFKKNKSAAEITRGLIVLENAGLARSESLTTGGREAEIWFPVYHEINEESPSEDTLNSSNSFNSYIEKENNQANGSADSEGGREKWEP